MVNRNEIKVYKIINCTGVSNKLVNVICYVAVPGSFLVRYKSGCGSQGATQVLPDVNFFS